jgi:hypothetical protein
MMFAESGLEGQLKQKKQSKQREDAALLGRSSGEDELVHTKLKKILQVMFSMLDPTGFSTRGHASVRVAMGRLRDLATQDVPNLG